MQIFLPSSDELNNDFRTSFTFDSIDEQTSFITWLEYMNISHVKAKIPCIIDGKMTQQTCVVINNNQTHNEVTNENPSRSSSIANLDNQVEEENEEINVEESLEVEESKPEKKKKKKSKHVEHDD